MTHVLINRLRSFVLCWCLKEVGKRIAILFMSSSTSRRFLFFLSLPFCPRGRNFITEGWECESLGFICPACLHLAEMKIRGHRNITLASSTVHCFCCISFPENDQPQVKTTTAFSNVDSTVHLQSDCKKKKQLHALSIIRLKTSHCDLN